MEAGLLREIAEAASDLETSARAVGAVAEQLEVAPIRCDHRREDAEQRRLARAVRSEQAGHTRGEFDVDPVERHRGAESLGQPCGANRQLHDQPPKNDEVLATPDEHDRRDGCRHEAAS